MGDERVWKHERARERTDHSPNVRVDCALRRLLCSSYVCRERTRARPRSGRNFTACARQRRCRGEPEVGWHQRTRGSRSRAKDRVRAGARVPQAERLQKKSTRGDRQEKSQRVFFSHLEEGHGRRLRRVDDRLDAVDSQQQASSSVGARQSVAGHYLVEKGLGPRGIDATRLNARAYVTGD